MKLDNFKSTLLGLAIGDALGAPLEFTKPGTFQPINDFIEGGQFNLKPGEFTDDTSLALCLAESLSRCKGFDAKDQMETYWKWFVDGHLSVGDKAIGVGQTTMRAILRSEEHTSELQSRRNLVCRLLLEKKK